MYMATPSRVSVSYFDGYNKIEQGGGDQVVMYTTTPSRVGVTDLDEYGHTEQDECATSMDMTRLSRVRVTYLDGYDQTVTIFLLHPHILLLSFFSIHHTWRTTRIIATHLFLIVSSHSILLRSL